MVKIMENPIKMDDWGGTLFLGNIHFVFFDLLVWGVGWDGVMCISKTLFWTRKAAQKNPSFVLVEFAGGMPRQVNQEA